MPCSVALASHFGLCKGSDQLQRKHVASELLELDEASEELETLV